MGQRHNQMGKLPEAVERTKTRGSEELAGPLQVHDRVRGLTGPAGSPPWSILLIALILSTERLSLGSRNRMHLKALVLHRRSILAATGDREFYAPARFLGRAT